MKLSIIIPCYNEKHTIMRCLERVFAVDLGSIQKEIIIVDDGSTDGTKELLENIKNKELNIIYHSHNYGKGSAIKTALRYVSGEVVIIQDADLEYDPNDYKKLLDIIVSKNARVVYGSRSLNKENQWSHFLFFFGGIFLSLLTNLLYGAKITDEPTCYKMFKADVLKSLNIEADGFDFCPEVTAKILKKGITIYEVPISYAPRHIHEGKKISWKDGLTAIWTLIKYRLR